MSAENAWRIARERCASIAQNACLVPPDGGSPSEEERVMCALAAKYIMKAPMPPAFRAEVEAEVQRRAIADRAALPGYMPRYFGVWSSTGVHIGIWGDPVIARDVLTEYPGGIVREMVDVATFNSAVEAEAEELRGMLAEARLALRGMLAHSCVADAGSDMKDEEDHAAERLARALLSRLEAKGESHE